MQQATSFQHGNKRRLRYFAYFVHSAANKDHHCRAVPNMNNWSYYPAEYEQSTWHSPSSLRRCCCDQEIPIWLEMTTGNTVPHMPDSNSVWAKTTQYSSFTRAKKAYCLAFSYQQGDAQEEHATKRLTELKFYVPPDTKQVTSEIRYDIFTCARKLTKWPA